MSLVHGRSSRCCVTSFAQVKTSSVGLLTVTVLLACASAQAGAVPLLETLQAEASHVRAGRAARLDLSAPRITTAGTHPQALRLDTVPASGSSPGMTGVRDLLEPEPADSLTPRTELNVRWQSSPGLVRVARKFRRNGLPVVRLWASGRNLLAIGINPQGKPGVYFTQTDPD